MSIVAALALALGASLAIEAVEAGSARPISLRPADLALRLAAYALLAAFWFQFSWRPWLAGASCVATVAALAGISRLKRAVIGEPVVFSDFALLPQVPRHPELYYTRPLTDPRAALPILAALAGIAAWYALEPAVLPSGPLAAASALLGLPLLLAGLYGATRTRAVRRWLEARLPRPDLDADVARYGLPGTLLAYALRWRDGRGRAPSAARPPSPPRRAAGDFLVVVQLESFVDPVRLGGPALPLMDRIRTRAAQYGRLTVPAHGAYTMRTEHAVLTGRGAADLGFGLYDPYLTHGGREPTSLARLAAAAGYEPVFVHPFHRDFFNRARVVRELGFARLVMGEDFADAPRIGPYVGDVPLGRRILAEVGGRTRPIFVYAVTMENHGPWRPGRLPGIDDPLAQYLHHVANTGRAVEALIDGLEGSRGTLCVFGDHAPALPTCRPGFGDTATDYAILRFGPRNVGPAERVDLAADALGRLLRGAVAHEPVSAGAGA